MSTQLPRPTRRWAATAVAAGSISALLASPLSLGTASAHPAPNRHVVTERPVLWVSDVRSGVISLHARTHPALEDATVYMYEVRAGQRHLIGYAVTGAAGRAHRRLHLEPGSTHKFVAKVVQLNRNRAKYSNSSPVVKRYESRYSRVLRYKLPS